jgi:hypothetical protein
MAKQSKNSRSSSNDFFNTDYFKDEEPEEEIENFEKATNEEVSEHMLAIRKATADSRKSLENQWSTDFYFCAFFADEDQRNEFLRKAGALGLVKDNFINGAALAEALGIELTPKEIEVPKLFAAKKDWLDITM